MTNKYAHLITSGVEQSLGAVPFHHDAPLSRYVMMQKDAVQGEGLRIVTHVVHNLPEKVESYCDLHQHEFDEINLIISEDSSLRYRIMFEDEVYEVGSPTTVYIPKGVRHAAEAISGKGVYVAILCTKEYKAAK